MNVDEYVCSRALYMHIRREIHELLSPEQCASAALVAELLVELEFVSSSIFPVLVPEFFILRFVRFLFGGVELLDIRKVEAGSSRPLF